MEIFQELKNLNKFNRTVDSTEEQKFAKMRLSYIEFQDIAQKVILELSCLISLFGSTTEVELILKKSTII